MHMAYRGSWRKPTWVEAHAPKGVEEVRKWGGDRVCASANAHTNQLINQLTNQSTNQPTNLLFSLGITSADAPGHTATLDL